MKAFSIGYMTQRLQKPPASIEGAISELKLAPTLELNGVPYFGPEAETAIADLLDQRAIERIKQSRERRIQQ
jgi:hypothetical protein